MYFIFKYNSKTESTKMYNLYTYTVLYSLPKLYDTELLYLLSISKPFLVFLICENMVGDGDTKPKPSRTQEHLIRIFRLYSF